MDIEELKAVITQQREAMEDLFRKEKIIDRDADTSKLKAIISRPSILALLGVRRCGKSVFSWLLLRGKVFGYVNFFDERLLGMNAQELNKVVQAFYELYGDVDYLVFDEIDRVSDWEAFVSRLRVSKRVLLTGSNSSMLYGKLATLLTGRHVDFELMPFSFAEYLKFNGIALEKNWQYSQKSIAVVKRWLSGYIRDGGFPEAGKAGGIILQSIYKDIIENDIIKQHSIRNPQGIRELAKFMVSNVGKEVTFNRLKGMLGVKNIHTIIKYTKYISDAYLIFALERFSYKLKAQFRAPKKIYCIDTGIVNSVSFRSSCDIGRLMENTVAVELLRRKNYSGGSDGIYYWRDYRGREVDFVVKSGAKIREIIQVAYISDKRDLADREGASLIEASKQLRCGNLTTITWDYSGKGKAGERGINFIPLWKWLLNG